MPEESRTPREEPNTPRIMQSSPSHEQDVESIVLRMHNKMKTLESRYLDLANFYKRELLSGGAANTTNATSNQSRAQQQLSHGK